MPVASTVSARKTIVRVNATATGLRLGSGAPGQSYYYRSAAGTPRLSGSDPRPRALRREGRVLRYIFIIVYLVVGVVIASSHHYFTHLNSLTSVLSALLAVVLWPLILFGVNLHIK